MTAENTMRWFGPKAWNLISQESPELRVPIPVGMLCAHCDEPIVDGESGMFMAWGTLSGEAYRPQHEECFVRQFIGGVRHQLRKCTCFGNGGEPCGPADSPGMTRRQEAALAVKIHAERFAKPEVHVLWAGRALCDLPGIPRDWPEGHTWVSLSDAIDGVSWVTCQACAARARTATRDNRGELHL